jgi:hypothetical protein
MDNLDEKLFNLRVEYIKYWIEKIKSINYCPIEDEKHIQKEKNGLIKSIKLFCSQNEKNNEIIKFKEFLICLE